MGRLSMLLALIAGCAPVPERPEPGKPSLQAINYKLLRERDVTFAYVRHQNVWSIILVVNAGGANHWFGLNCDYITNEVLGSDLSAMGVVHEMRPSPDGKWLAVLSVGEGHPVLEVIDLTCLLAENNKEYKVLRKIDPYPGGVQMSRWEAGKLVIQSDMLLTHLGKGPYGRVPAPLEFPRVQTFALSVETGHITPMTPDAGDPLRYFRDQLSRETHPGQREEFQRAIDLLSGPSEGKSTTPAK